MVEVSNMNKKRLSPFGKEYWMEKGYSDSEAEYKRNSIRPIRKEYWMEKGYSEKDSIIMAENKKKENNIKGAKKSSSRSNIEKRKSSPRCIEYWMEKGYNQEESKIKVSETQSTFSLDKCIEKYGIKKGTIVWKKRQNKWQKSLNSKSDDEISIINSKKNCILPKDTINHTIEFYKEKRGMILFDNINDYIDYQKSNNNCYVYYPVDLKFDKIGKLQKNIFYEIGLKDNDIKKYLSDNTIISKFIVKSGKQAYRMWIGKSLLRSSLEIYFYEKYVNKFGDECVSIDVNYPKSNFRYDFFVKNNYIEIAPEYNKNEKYTDKMNKKKDLFNCILLCDTNDINNFIGNL